MNDLARKAVECKQRSIQLAYQFMRDVDNHLAENGLYDYVHYNVWCSPDHFLDDMDNVNIVDFDNGVLYQFEYQDAYEEICDSYTENFIFDEWCTMSIEEVANDIVRRSKEVMDKERRQALLDLKRQAEALNARLLENDN